MASGVEPIGIRIERVWVNTENLNKVYYATTISLNLSNYDFYFIKCKYNTSTARFNVSGWFPVNGDEYQVMGLRLNNNNSASRAFTYVPLSQEMNIADAYYNGSTDSTYMLPVEIYGVKL